MELLSQLDGFESLGAVKIVMATNRPDILDPALLRPGRLDRKIEIPLPNEASRLEILKIHAGGITKRGDIDYESVVKLADGFNGADLRNICTEAGLFAIRDDRDYVLEEDLMKAARKISEVKKLESKLDYSKGTLSYNTKIDLQTHARMDTKHTHDHIFLSLNHPSYLLSHKKLLTHTV